jgi:phospholipid/cholesterol/gamma-HCH transport system permease protein
VFSNRLQTFLSYLGQAVQEGLEALGFFLRGRWRPAETLHQLQVIVVASLPMILLLAAMGGGILSLQIARRFLQNGADAYVGGLAALAMVREMVPIFTAMGIGARVGTAVAGELGHMSVTDQLSALEMLHIRLSRYLVQPRLIAFLMGVPLLTIVAEFTAIAFGMLVANLATGLSFELYLQSVWLTLKPYDIGVSLVKAYLFGLTVCLVSCIIGLRTKGGARQVGQSAMQAAVYSAVLIILLDLVLSWFFYAGAEAF